VAARLLGAERDLGRRAGAPVRFADFINPRGAHIADLYRQRFRAGNRDLQAPRLAVAVWALCAPTDEEAEYLASSSRMSFTKLRRGELIPVPPPDEATEFLSREARLTPSGEVPGRRGVIGSPEKVRAGLEEVASAYGADELIVVTITHDHGMRRRSYELLAEAFGLEPRALAASAVQ
jgi:alkanesulfonate monooxygenase SsuD/methylene tetrahydromethanopterin reductase-like flavin-dependent oxidoreductase (luciferase family)